MQQENAVSMYINFQLFSKYKQHNRTKKAGNNKHIPKKGT